MKSYDPLAYRGKSYIMVKYTYTESLTKVFYIRI